MNAIVDLYSSKEKDIYLFLTKFYDNIVCDEKTMKWEKIYNNPIEMVDIVGAFIDNNDKYSINMWICIDDNFFINVTDNNANKIIKYLYERYPY